MAAQKFDISKLGDLDPKIVAQIQMELVRLVEDIKFRPGESGTRKLLIEMRLTPDDDQEGITDHIGFDVKIKTSLPVKSTRSYSMGISGVSDLVFNPASPDSIRQRTLDEISGAKESQGTKE